MAARHHPNPPRGRDSGGARVDARTVETQKAPPLGGAFSFERSDLSFSFPGCRAAIGCHCCTLAAREIE